MKVPFTGDAGFIVHAVEFGVSLVFIIAAVAYASLYVSALFQ